MLRRAARGLALTALLLSGSLFASCAGATDEGEGHEADAYAAVVAWVLAQPQYAPQVADGERSVVFIESLASGAIDLEVQVEIVGHFDEVVDIRFIDTRTEAIDGSEPGAPVRDGGVLLGLGAVPASGALDIRGEVYRALDDVTGYRFLLVRSDESILLSEPPEEVEPEGLVTDP